MIDVKRLRVLREVAQQGSFSAAGEALGYTQSAVSQQIAAFERETGTTLVERNARGVRLTDAGRALVEHADGILARLAAAEDELEAIAGLRGGRVRLASFPTAGATLVPFAIADFSQRHPEVELSLVEAEPEEAIPALKGGELDIALTFEYESLRQGGLAARALRRRARPPPRRPHAPRPSRRSSVRPQAPAPPGRPRRGAVDPGRLQRPVRERCTSRPARPPASSRASASRATTTTWSRASWPRAWRSPLSPRWR